jgi:pyruvate/2-oxoglutarate dehydrogenase complex dihydrolipoamide acyltransferase (E2) component
VGEATKHHRELNTYRHGVRKSIVFEDVDIPIPVERTTRKEKRPMAYVIRKVDKKSIIDITTEIRAVQKETVTDATQLLGDDLTKFEKFALGAPMPIKKMILSIARRSAFLRKEFMGTVGVSSIGMFGKFSGWAIPLGIPATLVVMGGVTKKPGVIDNDIVIREFLPLTITVDHDIVDGAPLARFVDHLTNLIESGFGLIDL